MSGMFVAVEPAPDDTSTLDLFAATVKEMYDGDLTQGLRVPASDELDGNQSVRVIVVAGDEGLRVLVRMQAQPNLVLAVICPANANLGLSLAKARHLAMTHEVEGV
jgi:predicted regulator of Ras-like GTPase activity (Roadblock/LC7/MglB family)